MFPTLPPVRVPMGGNPGYVYEPDERRVEMVPGEGSPEEVSGPVPCDAESRAPAR